MHSGSERGKAPGVTTRDVVRRRRRHRIRLMLGVLLCLFLAGLLWPDQPVIPVEGANHFDWQEESFWQASSEGPGVHRGIDISAAHGTPVLAASPGLVLFTARLGEGAHAVVVLGPKWRVHTYANLEKADLAGGFISRGTVLGAVGAPGEAGEAQLHYSILSLVPYPWRFDTGPRGWQKMFYLDPSEELVPPIDEESD